MKKLVVYLSVGVLLMSLSACGRENAGTNDKSTEQTTEQTSEQPESMEGELMDISNGWSEQMETLKTAVKDVLGDNYWPDTAVEPETLEMLFGIAPEMYTDYLAEMPMMNTNVDTLLIIQAKDDKVEAVEEALNTYRDGQINNSMQYPMNVGKVQASRIEVIGNYVCFVQLGADTMTALESGDEAVIAQCQADNELAIEVIGQNVQH